MRNYRHPGPRRENPRSDLPVVEHFRQILTIRETSSVRLRFAARRMQNAFAALQNLFKDGHLIFEKPKENQRKTTVVSLMRQSSGAPGCGHFCSDLMVYACKTHLRLSRTCSKMGHPHFQKPKENKGFQPQTPVFRSAWLWTLLL